jgi:hypothetical protein
VHGGTALQDQHNGLAKFLEAKGMPEQALEVATDPGGRRCTVLRCAALCCR